MPAALHTRLTVDAFIAWALDRPGRYELEDGAVIAMSPERVVHVSVKGGVYQELRAAIRRGGVACTALTDGATVRIDAHTAYEPDALVYCGPALPPDAIEVPGPVVVVEVLSPATERRDGTTKVTGYFRVAGLCHLLIVDPVRRTVVHHARDGEGVRTSPPVATGRLILDPPGLSIDVEAVFDPR